MKDVDLSDHEGPAVQSSGFHMDEQELEKGDVEIGVKDGEGYIKFPWDQDGEVVEFQVPRSEVESHMARRREKHPHPTQPDGFGSERPAPRDWRGGRADHTGGGIYCRIWRNELDGHSVEVIYGVPECNGVDIGVYSEDKRGWLGELDRGRPDEDTDEQCFQIAKEFMQNFDDGEYEDEFEELTE